MNREPNFMRDIHETVNQVIDSLPQMDSPERKAAYAAMPNVNTGNAYMFNGQLPRNNHLPPNICITSLKCSEPGWVMARYCPLCRTTVFELNPYGLKPTDGDFFLMNGSWCCEKPEHALKDVK